MDTKNQKESWVCMRQAELSDIEDRLLDAEGPMSQVIYAQWLMRDIPALIAEVCKLNLVLRKIAMFDSMEGKIAYDAMLEIMPPT